MAGAESYLEDDMRLPLRLLQSKAGVAVEPPTAWTFFFSVDEAARARRKEEDLMYKSLDGAVTYPHLLSTPCCTVLGMHLLFMVVPPSHASRSKV